MTTVQVTAGRATTTASNGSTLTPTNYGSAQDYTGIAPVEPGQVEEWQTDAPPVAYDGPLLAGGMVGASPPASVALCSGTPATTTAR